MKLYLLLAWRNVLRHRLRSLILIFTVILTMILLMIFDGLYNGMRQEMDENAVKILGGNIQIHNKEYTNLEDTPLLEVPNNRKVIDTVRGLPEVNIVSHRIYTTGMASSPESAYPVQIIGIEPEIETAVIMAAQKITAGRFLKSADRDMVIIGNILAKNLKLKVGDRITMAGTSTHERIRSRTMTVAGIYDIGMSEIESNTTYISLAEAQELYNLTDQSTEIVIWLNNIADQDRIKNLLQAKLPDYNINTWKVNYQDINNAMDTEETYMNIMGYILMTIAGIGIYNLLHMAVFERTREIGILSAIGLKPRQISYLFLIEGSMIGVIGLIAGIVLGLIINAIMSVVGFGLGGVGDALASVAMISDRIYFTLGLENLVRNSFIVASIALLASFFPAREAARQEPAVALHSL